VQIDHPDGTQVRITRTFPADPDRVFRAFTDAREMTRWIWGDDAANVAVSSDARIGGTWSASIDAPPGDDSWPGDRYGMCGVYAVVDVGSRLVYTLHWDAPVGYNLGGAVVADEAVIVDFTPAEDGTTVVFRHIGIPDDGVSAAEHGRGVATTFDALAQTLE